MNSVKEKIVITEDFAGKLEGMKMGKSIERTQLK